MARIASVAIGGYYPTPPDICAEIARILSFTADKWRSLSVVDPCAGDGAAIRQIAGAVAPDNYALHACELEASRAKALKEAAGWRHSILAGDAFHVSFGGESAGLLFLNPPYDTDKEYHRLEHRFLVRFTPVLKLGGLLVFVVPYYSLAASTEYLATHYDIEGVVRFPEALFDAFKQVVVFARRTGARLAPDASQSSILERYAADGLSIPVITDAPGASIRVLPGGGSGVWRMEPFDVAGLLGRAKPWARSNRGRLEASPGILPDLATAMLRVFPVATAPRPAHIAAGIASGIFNGARITPDKRGLPDLLVKGVFDREYRTVEEKQNKHGEVTGLVQVQQPKLVVTQLDLSTHEYNQLDEAGVAGLLGDYGRSLGRVMNDQCPPLYSPKVDQHIQLHGSPRKLYTAQDHAARALVKLLRTDDKSGVLLGEIGCGKTTVSVVAARSVGARRMLVVCPPHLLASWQAECAAVAPDLKAVVIESPQDVDRLAATKDGFIAILSREGAKLGHGWEGVDPKLGCPRCGAFLPVDVDFAKKRTCCEATKLRAKDAIAKAAERLAVWLDGRASAPEVGAIWGNRGAIVNRAKRGDVQRKWKDIPSSMLAEAIVELTVTCCESYSEQAARALFDALFLAYEPEWTAMVAGALLVAGHKSLGYALLLTLPPEHPSHVEAHAFKRHIYSGGDWEWEAYQRDMGTLAKGERVSPHCLGGRSLVRDGILLVDSDGPGDLGAATRALASLASCGAWVRSKPCGEFLYQAVPSPRRVALGKYITRFHPKAFDFLILDEAHEYSSEDAAQTIAAHRLAQLDCPKILMTGSIMNGYADSLFQNMWSASGYFRSQFSRGERARFVDMYGYKKRIVEERVDGKVVAFGSHSERVITSERTTGNAPGVLPLFILQHLLRVSVTLHKADLALDLPPCKIIPHEVQPAKDVLAGYERLKDVLVRRIKANMFTPELSGKLFGQLAELPSYLDRATKDVGNTEDGDFVIRYPESCGGQELARESGLPVERELTKELWALETMKSELARGRNMMVFSWHLVVLPRLARLVRDHLGVSVEILYADKVPPAKRQAWIQSKVVDKNVRVLICNPVAIQTGLNNLVHFASVVWMENPACNPIVYRQAIGRIDRIGQTKETRVYFPIYGDTLQAQLYELLMHKVAVSTATDGLDPESALLAAGLGDDAYLSGLSIGKQLWAMIERGESPTPKRRKHGSQ